MSVTLESARSTQRSGGSERSGDDKPSGSTSGSNDFASRASGLVRGNKMDPESLMREKPKVWVSTGTGGA